MLARLLAEDRDADFNMDISCVLHTQHLIDDQIASNDNIFACGVPQLIKAVETRILDHIIVGSWILRKWMV